MPWAFETLRLKIGEEFRILQLCFWGRCLSQGIAGPSSCWQRKRDRPFAATDVHCRRSRAAEPWRASQHEQRPQCGRRSVGNRGSSYYSTPDHAGDSKDRTGSSEPRTGFPRHLQGSAPTTSLPSPGPPLLRQAVAFQPPREKPSSALPLETCPPSPWLLPGLNWR